MSAGKFKGAAVAAAVVLLDGNAAAQGYDVQLIRPDGTTAFALLTGYAKPIAVMIGEMETEEGGRYGCYQIYKPNLLRDGSVNGYQKDAWGRGVINLRTGEIHPQPSDNSMKVWGTQTAMYVTNYQNVTFSTNPNGEGYFYSDVISRAVNPQTNGGNGLPKGSPQSPGGFCSLRFNGTIYPR